LVEAIKGISPNLPEEKTFFIALISTKSPTGVLVPCVLI
jgi:hypothetical protein